MVSLDNKNVPVVQLDHLAQITASLTFPPGLHSGVEVVVYRDDIIRPFTAVGPPVVQFILICHRGGSNKTTGGPYKRNLCRLGINHFFVNSENLGIRMWGKKCINYDKIEIAARLRKSHVCYPNALFFFLLTGAT